MSVGTYMNWDGGWGGGHILDQLGGREGCPDYPVTTAHFTRAVLCEGRKWFVFLEGNEWILLMGSRQLQQNWLQGKQGREGARASPSPAKPAGVDH